MQEQYKPSRDIIIQPVRIFPAERQQKHLIKVQATANRSYAIFDEFVLTWGEKVFKVEEQETERQSKQSNSCTVIPIQVTELAPGSTHTFAYFKASSQSKKKSADSSVYCWGSNRNYELGLDDQREYGLVKVDLFDEAFEAGLILKQISCGDKHTLAVFEDSQTQETKLFGWGESNSYQLALDTTGIVPYPVDIDYQFTSGIQKIESKSDFNIVVLSNGELYSWGSNMFNRLGLNQIRKCQTLKSQTQNVSQQSQNTSRQVMFPQQQSPVFNEKSLTDRRPTLAHYEVSKIQKVKIPRKIQLSNLKVAKVSLGTYHVIALTDEGQCLTWGNGIYGQLGNNKFGECGPQKISMRHLSQGTRFVDCSAGEQHSCLIDQVGNVYTCGSNSHGVLGHQKHENQTKKKRCKIFQRIDFFEQNEIKIVRVTSGDRHILAQSQNSQIYGWGSNKSNQVLFLNQQQSQNSVQGQIKPKSHQFNKKPKLNQTKNIEEIDDSIKIRQSNESHVQFSEELIDHTSSQQEKQQSQQKQKQRQDENIKQAQLMKIFTQKSEIQGIEDWKIRYKMFLTKKRKQQDALFQQLDEILSSLKDNKQQQLQQ